MNVSQAFLSILIIGHGPATLDWFGRVIVFALSIMFALAAFRRDTRVRGAFSYGKGPSVPINNAGHVILFLISIVLLLMAFGVLR